MALVLERLATSLGDRYAIQRQIGAGGMATVYLAEDRKHHRKVALKVLRPELSAIIGGERFLKEIEVTANLQHPNILALYDSGEADSFLYYVMPYVEGESLRDKLNREKQIAVEEVVEIGKSVAAALGHAHSHGVVHRDIKPENILLLAGQALVADFGIALAVSAAGGTRLTETGLSLGTPHYMSPEQATGDRQVDARTDIYSLGAVVYEMLTGDPPHTGNTVQAIVAKVLSEKPTPIDKTRDLVPPNVDAAVQRALAKSPADRFPTASQFADALANPAFRLPTLAADLGALRPRRVWNPVTWALTGVAAVLAVVALWGWLRSMPQPVSRFALALPADSGLVLDFGPSIALSPDGSKLVYVGPGPEGSGKALWIKERHQLQPRRLPGTEGAFQPFFAPDGQRVGFYAAGATSQRVLKVVSLNGEPPVALADSGVIRGGASWGSDGFIYTNGEDGTLVRVPETGGAPQPFTTLADGDGAHFWPDVLPSGRGVLFTAARTPYDYTDSRIAVADVATGEHRVLLQGAFARYATSGHLVFVSVTGALLAVPFDQGTLEISGAPVALAEGVAIGTSGIVGGVDLAVSRTGTLVYLAGSLDETVEELVWVDRDGTERVIDPGWSDDFEYLALSPDGRQLAVSIENREGAHQLWVKQLDAGPLPKLTFEGTNNYRAAWTPDGRQIAFVSNRSGQSDLWIKRADGAGAAEVLWAGEHPAYAVVWSPDGEWIVFQAGERAPYGLYGLRPGVDTMPTPLVVTRFDAAKPALSPDGRWLAYTSNESGPYEVYVVPFPNTSDAKWLVSIDGGTEPLWAHNGRELFYKSGARDLMAAEILLEPMFSIGEQRTLFSAADYESDVYGATYAVSPDDQRFIMIRIRGRGEIGHLVMVENFFEELKSRF